jgi:hypothetical protein
MLIVIILTFLLTTALYGALVFFPARRLAVYLQAHPEAVHALSQHLLLPLFGRAPDPPAGPDDAVPTDPPDPRPRGFPS